jgi:hypothetical protein
MKTGNDAQKVPRLSQIKVLLAEDDVLSSDAKHGRIPVVCGRFTQVDLLFGQPVTCAMRAV